MLKRRYDSMPSPYEHQFIHKRPLAVRFFNLNGCVFRAQAELRDLQDQVKNYRDENLRIALKLVWPATPVISVYVLSEAFHVFLAAVAITSPDSCKEL